MSQAQSDLELGNRYPYDAPDDWKRTAEEPAPPATDWAHRAARGVLSDLLDRPGVGNELEGLDEDIRVEIVSSIADIIRAAQPAA